MMVLRKLAIIVFLLDLIIAKKENSFHKMMVGREKEVPLVGADKPIVNLEVDQELATVEAGFVSTFTSKFFDDYN